MSNRSRADAFLALYLDFPRDAAGTAIPKPVKELIGFEDALTAFIESLGYKVRSLKFSPKDGRYVGPTLADVEERHD